MELVKGMPITKHCDQHKLGTRERLVLFLQVCHAVQHAHQKGIIHRDLKPSNVLVTMHDATPLVKVIDFGVAKAIGQQLTDKTLYTGIAQMLGTPLYMSPEQAGQSSLDVDTRSDVYSLGVLLYELLTGTTPFDSETLRKAGPDEMRRIIREDEPPRPSQRVSTLHAGQPSTISAQRKIDPHTLGHQLRGELDWIVMKTLEKDRNRRYETASAFAADVQRYLNDEAVQACPPSATYRLRKFARRHKVGLAVAGLVLFFLVLLGGGAGWILGDWQGRRTEAERQVVAALDAAQPLLAQGNPHDPELVDAARKAEAQLASGVVRADLRHRVEQLLADLTMLAKLEDIRQGETTSFLGSFWMAKADSAYAQAFREYGIDVEELGVDESIARMRTRAIAIHLAAALDNRAIARQQNKETNWKQFVEVARGVDSDTWRCAFREAWASGKEENLNRLLASAPTEQLAPTTLALLGILVEEYPKIAPLVLNVLREGQQHYPADFWINYKLAWILWDKIEPPQLEDAVGFYRAALALRPQSSRCLLNLGRVLDYSGRPDEAIACLRNAIRLKKDFRDAHISLGDAFLHKGLFDEAIASFRDGVPGEHSVASNQLGILFAVRGRLDEAIACFREAVRLDKNLAVPHANLGNALTSRGQLDEAIASYREAIQLDKGFATAHANLGTALQAKGQLDQAIASYREAILLKKDSADAHAYLGTALQAKGQLDEAIASYGEAILLDKDSAGAHTDLGTALQAKGQLDEAIACFRETIRLHKDSPGFRGGYKVAILEEHPIKAHINLGNALHAKGQSEEATACFREAIRLKESCAEAHDRLNAQAHLAWFLATCPDAQFRDPQQALELAKKLVEASPQWREFWKILGVAHYRARDWPAAVVAMEKAMSPANGGGSSEWFFLAMAHWQIGQKQDAQKWYDQAVQLMEKNKPQDEELCRFRTEAEELLEIKKK